MMVAGIINNESADGHDHVLDLSVNKNTISNNEIVLKQNQNLSILLSPPSSSSSSSVVSSPKQNSKTQKRCLETSRPTATVSTATVKAPASNSTPSNKRPLRFQCKHCDYKAPSTSLMQNHIYRHTDLTPYACAYCGHKSTTKSTIMVHIELCHPNMEVRILENRVREQDFYRDLNSGEIHSPMTNISEPQTKKARHSKQYDSEPINGVAISLKTVMDDGNESSSVSDEISETENLEPILFEDYQLDPIDSNTNEDDDHNEPLIDLSGHDSLPTMVKPSFKIQTPTQTISNVELSPPQKKESDSDDGSEYLLVYNRPKQYYGSLYEPDKQYACKLCSYTTNHRPSMEDHVFVHTNEKPYKCGYCGEEIYTRYAATYHIKYKHAGMARNFIQNKADVTQYYVNRAKREDEKNQFKVIDTRRVKVPTRNGKSVLNQPLKNDFFPERSPKPIPSPGSPSVVSASPLTTQVSTTNNKQSSTSQLQTNAGQPDYRVFLAWSYYLASQAAWLSPMLQQQQGQLPSDPQAIAKYLQQAMQNTSDPSAHSAFQAIINSHFNGESIETERRSKLENSSVTKIKKETDHS